MSKIDVENIIISKWLISVGQNGASLIEKGRLGRFDVIESRKWGVFRSSVVIESLISHIPKTERFDLILDDHVTIISYFTPAVVQSECHVTAKDGKVYVQFYDILKHCDCQLVCDQSDLDELIDAFSPYFNRIQRVILRGPAQDFRYIVYVETSAVVKKPDDWIGSIKTSLSSVLINRRPLGLNLKMTDAPLLVETAQKRDVNQRMPSVIPSKGIKAPAPVIVEPRPTPQAATSFSAADLTVADDLIETKIPTARPSADPTAKLTLVFSPSDDPAIALLAAGVVWSLPKTADGESPVSITEIGAFREKLSSPFRRLVGASAHQEIDQFPIPIQRLQDLIQDFAALAEKPGNHILFFGYETLSTELLSHISRFLQGIVTKYQVIVCAATLAQAPELITFETVFDSLTHKSWIYLDDTDEGAPRLASWTTCKSPSLDDLVLKKLMDGEFRVFETLPLEKTNLSILQSSAFEKWLAKFTACTVNP